MKKLLFLFLISGIFLIPNKTKAQDYNTGIGLRGGLSYGLTVKHFIGDNAALEGIFASRWKGMNITGLYEIHHWLGDVEGLRWYYGGGGHIGFWRGYNNHPWFKEDRSYTVIGVDGILGIEYNFSEIPLNLSLDWKPAFNIIGYSGFWGDSGALSIRYIF